MMENKTLPIMLLLIAGAGLYMYSKQENNAIKKSKNDQPNVPVDNGLTGEPDPAFGVKYPRIIPPITDPLDFPIDVANPWNPMPLPIPKPRYGLDLPLYPMPVDSAVDGSQDDSPRSPWTPSSSANANNGGFGVGGYY